MKKKNFLIVIYFVCAFAFILSNFLIKKVTNLDEFWNYNTARAISNGVVPYRELSMITTPFLPMCVALILKVTFNELIVFRVITSVVITLIVLVSYKIFTKTVKNKLVSVFLSIIILVLLIDNWALDYNFIVLLFSLILELFALKNIDRGLDVNKSFNLFLGAISGIAFCTKQTVGAFVIVATVLYQIIFIKNKKDFKKYIINAIYISVGALVPIGIFVCYLLLTNSFKDFIGYALLGIKTFSNSIPYLDLLKNDSLIIRILAIIVPLYLLGAFIIILLDYKKKIDKEKFLLVWALPMLIVLYPISDEIHFIIGIIPIMIFMLSVVAGLIIRVYRLLKWKEKDCLVFAFQTFVIFLVLLGCYKSYKNYFEYTISDKNVEIKHYKYLHLED